MRLEYGTIGMTSEGKPVKRLFSTGRSIETIRTMIRFSIIISGIPITTRSRCCVSILNMTILIRFLKGW